MIKEQLFENETPQERIQLLRDNRYNVEETFIERFHTAEEKERLRNVATDEMVSCQDIEDKISSLVAPLKLDLKQEKLRLRETLRNFKRGYEREEITLYMFDDQDAGMMCFYDETGKLIKSRKLLPTERQTTILNMNTNTGQ